MTLSRGGSSFVVPVIVRRFRCEHVFVCTISDDAWDNARPCRCVVPEPDHTIHVCGVHLGNGKERIFSQPDQDELTFPTEPTHEELIWMTYLRGRNGVVPIGPMPAVFPAFIRSTKE